MSLKKEEYPTTFESFNSEDIPYGFTYGQWTVKWWEWALSVPITTNPVLDDTGENATLNQDGPVWFLAGTIGDENRIAYRTCSVPCGKSLLFPVINYVYSHDPRFKTDGELIDHVSKDIDDIITRTAVIDDKIVPIYRVRSEPSIFSLNVKEENKLNLEVGINKAAADGYWVFLKPLNKGLHKISFHGSCSGGIRNASANYTLNVL
jgi:hypothetical protein